MSEFCYPAGDHDRPRNLLGLLGTFWTNTYTGRDQVQSYVGALAQLSAQTHLDLLELVASMSRYEVPLFHRDNWYLLTLKQSERNGAKTSLYRYGDAGIQYGGPLHYDVPAVRELHTFPLPTKLANVGLIMNRITEPSVTLTQSLDYLVDIERDAIVFRSNPFDNPLIATRPVYENGEIIDYEAALWLFRGEFDFEHIYRQFGYILGLKLQSSKGYRDLLNAIFDAIVGGTAQAQISRAFAAITGIPLVMETQETVEHITLDGGGRLVITDQHVYRFQADATMLVEVGDVVTAGDPLTDALEIIELNRGQVPSSVEALALGEGLLASCFYGDLVFENREVPLEVEEDHVSGYTYVKFGLGGFPLDVERFFDDLHARGIELATAEIDTCAGETRVGTLAHVLDTRVNQTGEPLARHLPSTINPLQFLVQNVLRNNVFLVRVKAAGMGRDALGLYNVRHLSKIVPPHTAMLLILELTVPEETVSVDLITESLGRLDGLEPLVDDVPESMVDDSRIGIRTVSGVCQ